MGGSHQGAVEPFLISIALNRTLIRCGRKKKTVNPNDAGLGLPFGLTFILLAVLLLATIVIATGMGYVRVSFSDVIRIMVAGATGIKGLVAHVEDLAPVVVLEVRMPRILTAALVGSGLAVCGAVFQGILLNPLADPYTLGVSAGAAFGASLGLLFNVTLLGLWSVPVMAFAGAVATLLVVIYLTAGSGDFSSGSLILSGIIVAAILSAGVSLIKYLADEEVSIIIFWLMGSFASKNLGGNRHGRWSRDIGPGRVHFLQPRSQPAGPGQPYRRIFGRLHPQGFHHPAGDILPGIGRVRGRVGHHRFCGVAGPPYGALRDGSGQPAADPCIGPDRQHPDALGRYPDPGRAAP